ncbi:MAG: hypothetical protein IJH91_03635 [Mogibacterium sp.]|nr:hypothetical protein [Mogibacterium sp.]
MGINSPSDTKDIRITIDVKNAVLPAARAFLCGVVLGGAAVLPLAYRVARKTISKETPVVVPESNIVRSSVDTFTRDEPKPEPVVETVSLQDEPDGDTVNYKGIRIRGYNRSREALTDALLDLIIDKMPLDLSEAAIEDEVEYQVVGNLQSLKYQSFYNPEIQPADVDVDAIREEVRRDVIRDYKIDQLLKRVITEENLTASPEELEKEAERIAASQGSGMDMVKMFFGEDLSGLEGEVLRQKAKELILENAVVE